MIFLKDKIYSTLTNIRIYKKNSVFFKYIKSLLIMLLIPAVVFVAMLSSLYMKNIRKNTELFISKQTLTAKLTLDNVFREIEGIQNILRTNINTQAFILSPSDKISHENTKKQMKYIQETITNQIRVSNTISDIYIYSFYNNTVLAHDRIADIDNFNDMVWYDRYTSTKKFYDLFTVSSADKYNLYYTTPLSLSPEPGALMVIKINILNILDVIKYDNADNIYVTDGNNNILVSNCFDKINKTYDFHTLKDFSDKTQDIYINTHLSVPVSASNFEFPELTLVMEFGSAANNTVGNIFFTLIVFIILTVILSIVVSFIFAMSFYNNITQIIQNTNMPQDTSNFSHIDNEHEYIMQNIMLQTSKIKRMENELADKMVLLKKSQIIALQSQINPHFIFNALNLVNVSLMSDGFLHHDAIHINSILSDIIHNILSANEYIITVRQEIEYTKKYIEIALIKTKNKFRAQWNIDSECLDLRILKFILQPIIENSIEHGFKQSKKSCNTLIISLNRTGSNMRFIIDDDGCGMDSDTLSELTQKSKTSYDVPPKNHIGYLNVNQRIKLLYGEQYGCSILKSDSSGTVVEIVLPIT